MIQKVLLTAGAALVALYNPTRAGKSHHLFELIMLTVVGGGWIRGRGQLSYIPDREVLCAELVGDTEGLNRIKPNNSL